jgi:hypothetical protein
MFHKGVDPILASCRVFLNALRQLIDAVRATDGMSGLRPAYGSKVIAAKMAAGIRMVEAYLRRVLLVLAFELEPTLVDALRPVARPHGRKSKARAAPFKVLDWRGQRFPDDGLTVAARKQPAAQGRAQPVALGRLYTRLDQLAAIAANPLIRARRLAFHMARSHAGPILAPDKALRHVQRWGVETAATFSLMAHVIVTKSRERPPSLAPPRRNLPTVTLLG